MKHRLCLLVAVICFLISFSQAQAQNWYKGNIHCHSKNSDGNVEARDVALWYKNNGYHFLSITDHNFFTAPSTLKDVTDDSFLLIGGEELTTDFNKKPLHINALNIRQKITPLLRDTLQAQIQDNVDLILQAGGIAQINHFLRGRFLDAFSLGQTKGALLLEVYNMNLDNHNFPAGENPGTEKVWDQLLSSGHRFWGTASDDAHQYTGDFTAGKACPGRGWIVVSAPSLTKENIVSSIEKGNFYASTGIVYESVTCSDTAYSLEIKPYKLRTYTTFFIGKDGEILKTQKGVKATYQYQGNEMYVRAKTVCSSGEFSVTQPHFLTKP